MRKAVNGNKAANDKPSNPFFPTGENLECKFTDIKNHPAVWRDGFII